MKKILIVAHNYNNQPLKYKINCDVIEYSRKENSELKVPTELYGKDKLIHRLDCFKQLIDKKYTKLYDYIFIIDVDDLKYYYYEFHIEILKAIEKYKPDLIGTYNQINYFEEIDVLSNSYHFINSLFERIIHKDGILVFVEDNRLVYKSSLIEEVYEKYLKKYYIPNIPIHEDRFIEKYFYETASRIINIRSNYIYSTTFDDLVKYLDYDFISKSIMGSLKLKTITQYNTKYSLPVLQYSDQIYLSYNKKTYDDLTNNVPLITLRQRIPR
jgi:hypothetical protein